MDEKKNDPSQIGYQIVNLCADFSKKNNVAPELVVALASEIQVIVAKDFKRMLREVLGEESNLSLLKAKGE